MQRGPKMKLTEWQGIRPRSGLLVEIRPGPVNFNANGKRENLARDTTEAFGEKLMKQCRARGIAEEEILWAKLERAQAANHRRSVIFSPGDTVFAWRQGIEKKRSAQRQGLNRGQWYGPGDVLGTEASVTEDNRQAGSVIWVVVNGRLWRCAPSQLLTAWIRARKSSAGAFG